MSNGFTNLPTSLLGTVAIGGSLSVAGGLTVGASPNIVRVGNFTGYGGGVSANLGFDAATRDNAAVTAALEALGANGNAQKLRRLNAAGAAIDTPINSIYGADFTPHPITGDTVEHIVYTRTIPGNLLGANGGFIVEVLMETTTFSAGAITLRIKLGGTLLGSAVMGALGPMLLRVHAANINATNSQKAMAYTLLAGAIAGPTINTAAIDTTANADLTVTLQTAVAGNVVQTSLISVSNGNSFGPV